MSRNNQAHAVLGDIQDLCLGPAFVASVDSDAGATVSDYDDQVLEPRRKRLVIFVIGSAVAGLAIVLAAVIFLSVQLMRFSINAQAGNAAGTAFLTYDIGSDELKSAYSRTSKRYQGKVSFQEFSDLLSRCPSLKLVARFGAPCHAVARFPDDERLLFSVMGPGDYYFCAGLVNEEGAWKVDDFACLDFDGPAQNGINRLIQSPRP